MTKIAGSKTRSALLIEDYKSNASRSSISTFKKLPICKRQVTGPKTEEIEEV